MADSSESGEESLYQPIMESLRIAFSGYIQSKPLYQSRPSEPDNPYLEITANRKISPLLQQVFDDDTFVMLSAEEKAPDIMGYVKRKPSSKPELVTVEVKDRGVRFLDIAQARLYQDIFKSSFGLLISSHTLNERKVRFLNDEIGKSIQGRVIICHYEEHLFPSGNKKVGVLKINPRFKYSTPQPFRRYCE